MSKIGVGVGDEFPVDDGAPKPPGDSQAPRDDRAEFEDWKQRRDAYRAQKQAWRAQRDSWKAHWREQRRAWHDERGEAFSGDYAHAHAHAYGRRGRRHVPFYSYGFAMRILFAVAVIALVVFVFSHIGYILAGLVAAGVLFAAWHHFGHDRFDFEPRRRDYSRTVNAPPPAPTPSVEKPNDPAQ